ncbi:MAG: T9SS type A sorting domain-containing protein [Chitinophagaceae bacterium]|nr:T9SS type A sorting domain-containing protein [Chitinophagaceae bacterium]
MKATILLVSLFSTIFTYAQKSGIFAVTDTRAGGASWLNISQVMPDGSDTKFLIKGQEFNGKRVELKSSETRSVSLQNLADINDLPLNSGVAALAFDPSHNRLYYSTMFSGDIRFVNLKDMNTYYHIGKVYDVLPLPNTAPINGNNQGPVITRMTMGADGYIYGLSNNGDGFFRVSSRVKNPVIENLGRLIDDPANGNISIHTGCTSWGGDMVGAADGSLYVFSMYQHVFKVNPNTKVATYMGMLKGVPGDFSVNGAAVQENGSIILSSAAVASKIAVIEDPANLTEVTLKQNPGWLNTSDLASGNLLFAKKDGAVFGEFERSTGNSGVGVYPNPITNGQIVVHFKEGMSGKHTLDLLDITGASKQQAFVNLNGQPQRITMRTGVLAQGIYLLRVSDGGKKEVETIKVLIQ